MLFTKLSPEIQALQPKQRHPSAEEVEKPNSKALNSQPVNYEFRSLSETKHFDDFRKTFETVLKTAHLPNLAKETKLIFLFMTTPTVRYVSTVQGYEDRISNILRENPNAKIFVLCAWKRDLCLTLMLLDPVNSMNFFQNAVWMDLYGWTFLIAIERQSLDIQWIRT